MKKIKAVILSFCAALAVALGMPNPAIAAPQRERVVLWMLADDGGVAKFFADPCREKDLLEGVKPEYRELFKAGELTPTGGETKNVCWVQHDAETIGVTPSQGLLIPLPTSALTKPDQI